MIIPRRAASETILEQIKFGTCTCQEHKGVRGDRNAAFWGSGFREAAGGRRHIMEGTWDHVERFDFKHKHNVSSDFCLYLE